MPCLSEKSTNFKRQGIALSLPIKKTLPGDQQGLFAKEFHPLKNSVCPFFEVFHLVHQLKLSPGFDQIKFIF